MSGPSFATRVALLLTALTVLACALATALNYLKFERLLLTRHERVFAIIGTDLVDTLERGMAIGVRLAEVPGAQALLDRAFRRDPDLRRLTVADAAGRILFDTERVRIGGGAEAGLLAAAAPASATGRRAARSGGLDWIAMPIANSFGQQDGSLLIGYGQAGVADRLTAIALALAGPGLTALAIALPLAWLAIFLIARPTRRLFTEVAAILGGDRALLGDEAALRTLREAIDGHGAALDDAARRLEAIAARAPEKEA